jgi:hypothetical protein
MSNSLFEKDKKYLENKIGDLERNLSNQISLTDAATTKCITLEMKNTQLADQLFNFQMQITNQHSNKFDQELKNIK